LGEGSSSCYCYQAKEKSTPRFGLGWEFDKKYMKRNIEKNPFFKGKALQNLNFENEQQKWIT
jgi:hypothetical protein